MTSSSWKLKNGEGSTNVYANEVLKNPFFPFFTIFLGNFYDVFIYVGSYSCWFWAIFALYSSLSSRLSRLFTIYLYLLTSWLAPTSILGKALSTQVRNNTASGSTSSDLFTFFPLFTISLQTKLKGKTCPSSVFYLNYVMLVHLFTLSLSIIILC